VRFARYSLQRGTISIFSLQQTSFETLVQFWKHALGISVRDLSSFPVCQQRHCSIPKKKSEEMRRNEKKWEEMGRATNVAKQRK